METPELVVVACKLHKEPAFALWASDVLKIRNRIINKIKSRYWKENLNFGILLPKTIKDDYRIDERKGNYFWRTAIEKELKTVSVAYKPYEKNLENIFPEQIGVDRKNHLVGYKEITCHFL